MCHVHILHEQVVRTHHGFPAACGTTADGHVFAYAVVVANLAKRVFAPVFEVLRFGADACSWEELVPVAYSGSVVDGDTVIQFVIVADDGILLDYAEGADDVVVADFCLWVNDGKWTDLVHVIIFL